LVKPALWPDPREDPCSTFVLESQSNPKRRQQLLSAYLAPCWAQCWSYEADSDVLLRAYSRVVLHAELKRNSDPANEGVRVTTTARKLIAAMETWKVNSPHHTFFLARVVYEDDASFGQSLANRLSRPEGPNFFGTPEGRAESMLVKLAIFRHEDEVRLLCIGTGRHNDGNNLKTMPIDPNFLFTEVRFDPRLALFERREREERLRALGFTGKFIEDPSHTKTFTIIPMPGEWPDAPA